MAVLSKFSTAIILDNLNKGDLIEFVRNWGYSHWAVYIDDGKIIHLTSPRENSSGYKNCCKEKGVVETANLTDEIGDSTWRSNNSKDKLFTALPADEIVRNAQSMCEKTEPHPDYNLLKYNCEHFASHCRYGVKYSKQAKIGKAVLDKAAKKVLLPKISELSKCIHEEHGRLTSETIEVVQNMAAQITTSAYFGEMLSNFGKINEVVQNMEAKINHLHLVGLVLKVLGCALLQIQADTLQELGEKMFDFGNTLMEFAADGFLVSIAGASDPNLKESAVLKGIADLVNIILQICIGDYGHAFYSLVAAVWPYFPAAIREKIEAVPVAVFNWTMNTTSWLYCSFVQTCKWFAKKYIT